MAEEAEKYTRYDCELWGLAGLGPSLHSAAWWLCAMGSNLTSQVLSLSQWSRENNK